MKDYQTIVQRARTLKGLANVKDRSRIRSVMNGGAAGVQAVLNHGVPYQGPGSGKGADTSLGVDLPTANIMWSGLERMAQRIGRPPTLKTDMIPTQDNEKARKKAEKRGRIVRAWDETSRMDMQYPQIGRWLPGYGFTLHVIRERKFGDTTYPVAELRDPYDVYPGMWGADQQPSEVAVIRHMDRSRVIEAYPAFRESFQKSQSRRREGAGIPIIGSSSGWEGNPHRGVEVIEYMCDDGTYVAIPEIEKVVSYIPNPLEGGPAFVVTKRFSFDQLQGQYHHAFGLMAMMGKLNILGLIATEDAVFRETNIIGEMVGSTYDRGRKAVNLFEPGTRVEKPTGDQLQQTWQAINIIERQFRIVAGYDVAQDGQSPNSFATGQGIKELGSAADLNVKEYQVAIGNSVELIDRKRLEWEEKMHASTKKKVFWFEGGNHFEEKYTPNKDIDKDYRTKRVYGAMATFDEAQKVVAGLQLVQARIMDRRTMQENMDGFDNVSLMNERMDQDQAKEMLLQSLGQRAAQGDPAADMALIEILDNPGEAVSTLKKLFTPQEPEMSEQEMAMAGAPGMPPPGMMPPGGDQLEGGPPPGVSTILSQMESPGGGAMTVGQM